MPHEIPSVVSNTKKVSAPTQKSGSTGPSDSGASRTVTGGMRGDPKPGFNGGKGF